MTWSSLRRPPGQTPSGPKAAVVFPFDPNQHEVMFETPSEGHPAGTVTQIMEPGYALKGRILRPARVGVARDEGQGSAEDQSKPGGQVNLDA